MIGFRRILAVVSACCLSSDSQAGELTLDESSPVQIEISVRDKISGQEVPCRIHLKDAAGKAHKPPTLPFWFDHFVCPGAASIELERGAYTIEIERGPEFSRISERIDVKENAKLAYQLERLVNLSEEGWWSGDLHVHRTVDDIELLMRAEDLHVAPVITWWNEQNMWDKRPLPAEPLTCFDGNRYYQVMAGEDEREGGALLYFHLRKPLGDIAISGARPSQ